MFVLQGVDQHAASGEDVFASRAADGGGDTVVGEIVAQPLHLFLVRRGPTPALPTKGGRLFLFLRFEGGGVGLMETDEVDAAGETA